MLADPNIIAALKADGVALLPGVLPPAQVAGLRPLLERAIYSEIEKWSDKPIPRGKARTKPPLKSSQPRL